MTTKTIQFQFQLGSTLTDVTSVVLQDPSSTFGIRRTDTLAVVVASSTALVHPSTGLYSYTFDEPEAGLNYEYWLEYVFAGNTKRIRQVLETAAISVIGTIPLAPTSYAQMGIDTVSCGDTVLQAFLLGQSNLVWAMQARRGVALDLLYQYYVSDLLTLALDHTRMRIDSSVGDSSMADRSTSDSLNSSSSNSNSLSTRTSSSVDSSSSSSNSVRSSSHVSNSSASMNGSSSASRNANSNDSSSMSQSASGSSTRTQTGASSTRGMLDLFGKSGQSSQTDNQSTISKTTYSGSGYVNADGLDVLTPSAWSTDPTPWSSSYMSANIHVASISSASYSAGTGNVIHNICPSVLGRIKVGGGYDADGALGDLSQLSTSSSEHARITVGSSTGSGSSVATSSGSRQTNRVGSSSAASNSSSLGSSVSSSTGASHSKSTRVAVSSAHSESAGSSTMTASSISHSEGTGVGTMTSSSTSDREYLSQIFESLKMMWEDTQLAIRALEKQMLMPTRYLAGVLETLTPQTTLVQRAASLSSESLIQRPGAPRPSHFIRPWNRWIVS